MCGIVGVYGADNASELTRFGLYGVQHRGQEAAGIFSSNQNLIVGSSLVDDVFPINHENSLEGLEGRIAIGHVRYSTKGDRSSNNAQPLVREGIAIAHNGNLDAYLTLKKQQEQQGATFQTTSDTELILNAILLSEQNSLEDKIMEALNQYQSMGGTFSLLIETEDMLVAAKDSSGNRPLCLGRLDSSIIFSSESRALDIIKAEYERELSPGEVIFIRNNKLDKRFLEEKPLHFCSFEFAYFSMPDSKIFNNSVSKVREKIGRQLAREYQIDADMVIPVPDTSNHTASGYSKESGIPLEFGLVRSHYVGRTFIEPSQLSRDLGVALKFNADKYYLKGKKVILIDDSIVRSTTSRRIVSMVRDAGAKEISFLVGFPPWKSKCIYGIDTKDDNELAINLFNDVEGIRQHIGADLLRYISQKGFLNSMPHGKENYCFACVTGDYEI